MKAIFIGCVESSEIFLRTLLENNADIVGVITKRESKFNSDFVNLSDTAEQNNIPYLYVENINDRQTYKFIKELHADIGFCLGWSQLLKKELLDLFPKGIIGFHPAALPKNRGRHPLIWALALGLNETASTFFILEEGADTGKIVSQERVPILYEDNARILYDRVMDIAKAQLKELWNDICGNNVHILADKGQKGNTWRKRCRDDGKIDWRMSSVNVYNLVRALSEPYVGAHFEYEGCEYKVWEVKELEDNTLYKNIEPGKVLKVSDNKHFVVKTGNGLIELIRYDEKFVPQAGMYL
ncbi:MAG: methionyl-tRNA formyltransferase [Lachnospiraceae bacterium]|nr:methionyl-tRNA formyltransferase [Lachnospiraceae bacterium]